MVWAAQTFPGSTLIWNARFFSMNMSLMFFSRDRPSSYGSRVHVVVLLRYSITGRDARIASDSSASATHSSRYFHKRSKRMAIDVLQDVLDTIRLQGLITGIHTFTTPWGYTTTPDSHDIAFLVMVQGGGILEVEEGDPPVRTLQSGDIVVLPRRTRYILRDKMHSPVLLFTELTELQTQRQGAVGNTTRIAKGCYQFVNISKKPVFSVLPPIIHLRKEDYQPIPELDLLVRLFLAEAAHEGSSQAAILNRLAEVLFMQMLRLFATQTLESASGWLRGLADPPIAAALQAIHANPAAQWTVARLASEAAFRKAFHQWIGMLPSQYQAHTGQ